MTVYKCTSSIIIFCASLSKKDSIAVCDSAFAYVVAINSKKFSKIFYCSKWISKTGLLTKIWLFIIFFISGLVLKFKNIELIGIGDCQSRLLQILIFFVKGKNLIILEDGSNTFDLLIAEKREAYSNFMKKLSKRNILSYATCINPSWLSPEYIGNIAILPVEFTEQKVVSKRLDRDRMLIVGSPYYSLEIIHKDTIEKLACLILKYQNKNYLEFKYLAHPRDTSKLESNVFERMGFSTLFFDEPLELLLQFKRINLSRIIVFSNTTLLFSVPKLLNDCDVLVAHPKQNIFDWSHIMNDSVRRDCQNLIEEISRENFFIKTYSDLYGSIFRLIKK